MDALSSARHCRRRLAAATFAATLAPFTPKVAAAFEVPQVMTGHPVDRVVAGAHRLFALDGDEVRTFDRNGETLGRCAGFAPPPQQESRRAPLGGLDADEALRAAGLPDDDSTPEAEDALEDEGLGPNRRTRAQTEGGIVPRALATSETSDLVWIATSSGVFRGDENGCQPAGLDGRDLLLVAAADGALVAATDDLLFMRLPEIEQVNDDDDRGNDGDATFTVIAGLTERPRALALGADAEAIVADDDGVLVIGSDGTTARVLERPTDAVAVCGGAAVALADDGVYRWTPGTLPVRTSDRPPVRGIACGPPGEARWIATGLGVWTSPDGATWTEREAALGRRVAGAATMGERVWVAIDSQLVAFDPTDEERGLDPPSAGRSMVPAEAAARFAPIPTHHLLPPTLPWPEVTALFGAARTPDRRSWQVMMLLTFPLGRAGGRRVDPTALAAESARRDEALAREQVDLVTAAGIDDEEVDDGERQARLASVCQEREALR